ncbi:MAG: esterase family protein [bacterium]|nr:esterase family protein [bacterium]
MLRLTALSAIALYTAAMLTADLTAQRGERRTGRQFNDPEFEHFTIERGTCETDLMRRGEASYYVLLPKGHGDDANRKKVYPWVLWLPGFGGPGDFAQRGGAKILDELRAADKVPEMAVVVYRARSIYMNGESNGRTEDLLTADLLTHLQKKYRLSAERQQRAVMGVSAGGFGALKIAMRHSDKFGAVAAHSSAILPEDPAELSGMYERMVSRMLRRGSLAEELGDPIDPEKWIEHMPMGIAKSKKPTDLNGLQIYFAAGTEDNYGFYPANEEFAGVLKEHGHKHLFHAVEDGGHAWSSRKMRDSVRTSLQFVAASFAGQDAIAATEKLLDGKADGAGKKPGDDGK